jgi:hypothetical protein
MSLSYANSQGTPFHGPKIISHKTSGNKVPQKHLDLRERERE